MSNLKDKIYSILRKPQLAGLATVTKDGKPWVRYVMTMTSEDLTIRCATMVAARKVGQISQNPEVHLTCGITNPMEMGPYLQVQGRAALNTSEEARHGFWSDMLAPIFSGPDDPEYGVIEITPYYIEYVTPGSREPDIWTAD
ncbi:MAG: pyridoxamine 5'-phosphate oxidase family protein [Sedimentisphaerales bacterium]|nr:pyridoxamine 5'-phosphate oxidase family protein [Sedimentisphaerales bacterium]